MATTNQTESASNTRSTKQSAKTAMQGTPRSLFEKIWDKHLIVARASGPSLLYIDRHIIHEGSFHAFTALRERGLSLRNPSQIFGVADHYVPTISRNPNDAATPEITHMMTRFESNMNGCGANYFPIHDARQGIIHVMGPEQGITLPGITLTCSDSHTSTHGAFGALAFGIGQSESAHVLATQSLWQTKPASLRVNLTGKPSTGVTGKDVILAIIAKIGSSGATGHVVEFAGPALSALSLEDRLTICNMTIEAGARFGMMAPDDVVFDYLYGRPFAPQGPDWDRALTQWRSLHSDPECVWDREVDLDISTLEPMVTWGTSPEAALPITGVVPDPERIVEPSLRQSMIDALGYMDLTPGTPLSSIKIDRIFIGSCTNARLADLRHAAHIFKGRRSTVPGIVVAGSMQVKRAAEQEGLDKIFKAAGLEWREPGCSMCVGVNGDTAPAGQRVASTSNRNFVGRQGPGVKTHLMSPAMVAAAAVTGHLTDARTLMTQS
ncbi:3-isopropylmalate dehydratase large subunit [Zwartia sp.]|uniref:3-isopropylmalate dehydratase large subunit n=1 Tax=Zwartia sp. TaxID=2978004 RepID=UPI0028A5931B|nr:3-isopropylmalate dehydratase large subunit [Zwartia sp.]